MKSISSILLVLLLMLASFKAGLEYPRGDVDQNGIVSIADVTCLIDYLLSGTWNDEPVTPPDEHEWVDLGLPSGTLWATCNVGAENPEDYGDYFAWGETDPKEYYNWSTYKWCNGSWKTLTKYCTNSDYGTVDNLTELDPEDDAAYVNWGPSWRIPTPEQQAELHDCSWSIVERNGVEGRLVTGPNGNSIFLPAAGYIWGDSVEYTVSSGNYWLRNLDSRTDYYATNICFDKGYVPYYAYRCIGRSIRAVRVNHD